MPDKFRCRTFAANKCKKRMEIITIESSAFKELTEQIGNIAAFVKMQGAAIKKEITPQKEYLTSKEVCELLHVSNRSLQRMRDAKAIGFTYVGNSCRYKRTEIEKYLHDRGTALSLTVIE